MGAYEAGEMTCGISAGNIYTFTNQSSVEINVTSTSTDLACLYVDEMEIDHPNATGTSDGNGVKTGRYWLIRGLKSDKVTDATTDFSVSLALPTSDTPDSNDKVCRYTGSDNIWDCAQTSYDTGNKTVTRSGVSAFSNWAVGNNVNPTDVTLGDLSARTHSSLPVILAVGLLGVISLSVAIFRRFKRNKVIE